MTKKESGLTAKPRCNVAPQASDRHKFCYRI